VSVVTRVTGTTNSWSLSIRRRGAARTFNLRVRVCDDGFGSRYEVPHQPGYDAVNVTDELTEFRLDPDATQEITA